MTKESIVAAFGILECEHSCSEEEVKSSYRQLVKVWHPDRFDTDSKLKAKATEKMKLINTAYQLLLGYFEEKHSRSSSDNKQPADKQTATTGARSTSDHDQAAAYKLGTEKIEITKECDSRTGKVVYRKTITVPRNFDGRYLNTSQDIFLTKPVRANESFEFAASNSMSFNLAPEQGRHSGPWHSTTPVRAVVEHEHYGDDYSFADGSSVSLTGIITDTLFHDSKGRAAYERKRAGLGRKSNSLPELRHAYHVFAKSGEWEVCVEIAQKLVSLQGNDWIELSDALHALNRVREAIDALKQAVRLTQYDLTKIDIQYRLARYSAQAGDLSGAKGWLEDLFSSAEERGYAPKPGSTVFEQYRDMAYSEPNLSPVRNAIPDLPFLWKARRRVGM